MPKPKPKKKPAPKIILIAHPNGKRSMKTSGGIRLYVSTYAHELDRKGAFPIVCGYSTVYSAGNEFAASQLDDVISQWHSAYGRGWRFEVRDPDDSNPRPVSKR